MFTMYSYCLTVRFLQPLLVVGTEDAFYLTALTHILFDAVCELIQVNVEQFVHPVSLETASFSSFAKLYKLYLLSNVV